MKKAYRRPLSLRIPFAGLPFFMAIVAPFAAMLALAPGGDPDYYDLLPSLTVAVVLFVLLIYLAVRVAVWGYVVTDNGVRVVGLLGTETHEFRDMKLTEEFQVWEREHHPPQHLFGGYIVRDFIGGEMFRIRDCNDIADLEHEIQSGINLSQRTHF